MKTIKVLAVLIILSVSMFGQKDTTKQEDIFTIVEKMPEFPGGKTAMMQYIAKNVVYPKAEKEAGIGGIVYVTFVVERDGKVDEAKVLKGVPNGSGLDAEALRVVNAMPKWKPGTQSGLRG